ncbi:MAG: flagellar export chaperone FliS [Rhodoferax sp.]
MFTPVSMRSANSYRSMAVENSVATADPHALVSLLFEGLLQSLAAARAAIQSQDVVTKGRSIGKAVRIIEEGLKAGLDTQRGGEIAANLQSLYDYCIVRVTEANLRNDVAAIDEVMRAIAPVAEGWRQIRGQVVAGA